jgi:hypothetical protein
MKSPQKLPLKNKEIKDNYISWFEIPALNFQRAVSFYNSIYQIKMETNEMNGYSMAFFPAVSSVGGAIICGEGSEPSDKGALLYLNGGEDLNQVLSRVEAAGGRVLLTKQQINEEAGYFALFIDSEGNKLALHSTK